MFRNAIPDITVLCRPLVFSQSCFQVSASLANVSSLAFSTFYSPYTAPCLWWGRWSAGICRKVVIGLWATRICCKDVTSSTLGYNSLCRYTSNPSNAPLPNCPYRHKTSWNYWHCASTKLTFSTTVNTANNCTEQQWVRQSLLLFSAEIVMQAIEERAIATHQQTLLICLRYVDDTPFTYRRTPRRKQHFSSRRNISTRTEP